MSDPINFPVGGTPIIQKKGVSNANAKTEDLPAPVVNTDTPTVTPRTEVGSKTAADVLRNQFTANQNLVRDQRSAALNAVNMAANVDPTKALSPSTMAMLQRFSGVPQKVRNEVNEFKISDSAKEYLANKSTDTLLGSIGLG